MTQAIVAASLPTLPPVALIDRKAFADALTRVSKVVERRNTIPILSNVRLVGTGESLIIEGCDLDAWSRVTVPAAADSRFAVTVPAHMLRDVVKKAASEYVEATSGDILPIGQGENVRDTQNVYLDFEGAKTALQAFPVADWPLAENMDTFKSPTVASFTMATATLRRLFQVTQIAISTEETRYYLNGIFFHVATVADRLMLRATATDGHRLVSATVDLPEGAEGMQPADKYKSPGVIVPRKTVALVLAELKRKGAPETVAVEVGATWIRFTIGAAVIWSKIVDGSFPDYCRVIPQGNDKLATVDAKAFAGMVSAVSQIASERGRAVKLTFEPDTGDRGLVEASVSNPDSGSASQVIECLSYTGDALQIGFNVGYMLDLIEAIGAPRLVFKFGDPGSPTLIEPAEASGDGVDVVAVLMPMRV